MQADVLRALQAPIKERYKADSRSAIIQLRAVGRLGEGLACRVDTARGLATAGLHPQTGGDGSKLCSGDMLLEALVACAGVTLNAVATALGVSLRDAVVTAEGEIDARGTLGMTKDIPVGFQSIRLQFKLDTDAPAETTAKLIELTERYCVVYQTLCNPPRIAIETVADPR